MFPATVEKRTNTSVRSPARWNRSARVTSASDSYVSKNPWAPNPRAWTTRSGIRSWSKWKIFSRKWKSSSSDGPPLARSQRVLVVGDRNALLRRQPRRPSPAVWCVSPPFAALIDQLLGPRLVVGCIDRR